MKLVKMSLLAATLIASSAFAIDNVKVSGDAKLYYSADDMGDVSLFSKDGAYGQVAAHVGLTADLTEGVSAGVSMTALSTMGLQGRLVNNIWEPTNGLDDYFWFDEAWLAGTYGKTTAKVGRMALDTPIVFTETWSIASNTFEAAVLINQDIPDTTLVAAFVGGSNGGDIFNPSVLRPVNGNGTTNFGTFYDGAYAYGAVNNSWKPLTVQAWYYKAFISEGITPTTTVDGLDAYWIQADLAMDMGLIAGLQYSGAKIHLNDTVTGDTDVDGTALAVMVGYEMKDTFTVKAAFSQIGEDHSWGMNLAGSGQSKLYTEVKWATVYGYVVAADTTAINVTATTPEALTWAALGLYATQTTQTIAGADDLEMTQIALDASKSFGPLDTTLAFINTTADNQNQPTPADKGDSYNTVQAYLTYNF